MQTRGRRLCRGSMRQPRARLRQALRRRHRPPLASHDGDGDAAARWQRRRRRDRRCGGERRHQAVPHPARRRRLLAGLAPQRQHGRCLNAGGRAPRQATPERYADGIPTRGALPTRPFGGRRPPRAAHALRHAAARHAAGAGHPLLRRGLPRLDALRGRMERLATAARAASRRRSSASSSRTARPTRRARSLRQPELAPTLATHRRGAGARASTTARPADLIAEGDVTRPAALIEKKDLDQEQAHWQEPLMTTYARLRRLRAGRCPRRASSC